MTEPRPQALEQTGQRIRTRAHAGTLFDLEIACHGHLFQQCAGMQAQRDRGRRQRQAGEPFLEQDAQMGDVTSRCRQPDAQARAWLRAMPELQCEHGDGGLALAQESLQLIEQRLAGRDQIRGRFDLVIGSTPCIETLRTAKPASHIRAPAERAIELIQRVLAEPARQATARQAQEIADGPQAQAGEPREQLFGPTQATKCNWRETTRQVFGSIDDYPLTPTLSPRSTPSPACGRGLG
jgi:hypothetical protein